MRIASWLLVGVVTAAALGLASLVRADVKYQPDEISLYVGDARFFEKWDDYPFDREPYAKEGFFVKFNLGRMLIESPEPAAIGADGILRDGFFGTLGPMLEFNSVNTAALYNDKLHEFQDTEVGYMERDQGWFVRFFDIKGHDQEWVRSDVGVIFNDPQRLLIGFYDLDGDGLDDSFDGDLNFGRDGGAIDAGDLVQQGVIFGELQTHLRQHFWQIEANHVIRLNREICGAYWEPFCGIRFLEFDEDFDVEGIGGVIGDSFWNTEVQNRMVGPQVGIRWFRSDGQWTFSTESRAMLAFNFQTADQTYSFGSRISQLDGRGTDPVDAGDQFIRSRFDRFVAREGVNSEHEMEIGYIIEVSTQASYAITRSLSLDFGLRGMCIDGVGRPTGMVNYTFPTLGINMDNNHQRILMAGGYIGFNFNR
jgi:hypothetical protein